MQEAIIPLASTPTATPGTCVFCDATALARVDMVILTHEGVSTVATGHCCSTCGQLQPSRG